MYAKGKGSTVPSDAQAREKLALYVYEYLLHVGAQKSAQTFLSEIRWEKNITLGEPPGFLHSWWCVFWDLYCAAPERRDTCDHSSEAKAFHDYGFVNSGYGVNGMAHNPAAQSPLGQMPPQDGMPPGGPMPPGFFPPFMSPRYPGGPRGPGPVRMPPNDFNPPGGGGGQIPMNSMDSRPGHPGMMGPRMGHPGSRMPGPMNPYDSMPNYGMRGPPPNSMGPGPGPGGMPPMSMPGGAGNRWPPTTSSINYSSASPGSYNGPGAPGTPIMPSPQGSQGPFSPASHQRMGNRPDSTNSGDGMYGMMKGGMPGMAGHFPGMGPGGPDGSLVMGPEMNVMNGDIDGMKNSPVNGPGTPRDDLPPEHNESAAILKIKESMQEEAKRFEKDDHPEYNFMAP
ncbi:Single-stranded DNA-binding protein 3,Single-stranded DNA-binding protein 4,Single-stranded DNA-binding protein 2 [Mytilus coruscus]|uniref:Single-stranded DNA-binding protein 3,Single-stranded DNA-binding protein 4,Single-stranded DNA-binding protein 2 n=1 Tax=Mytilus coruscus TaxID=42192 RepID=A0A6J8BRC1_MYTCO|nr:Single-stranded DNA-binding protein 3,Single-stranded DNA-binding protein 4,Single-stranded DNA-binding protein 2 [Mytilus coruscus]